MLKAMSVVPVGEEGDLVSRHVERSSDILLWLVLRSPGRKGRGCQEACPFAGIIQIKFAGISQINCPVLPVLKPCSRSRSLWFDDLDPSWQLEGRYRA
jgi:hypothetical protein